MTEYEVVYKKTVRVGYKVVAESADEAASKLESECGKPEWEDILECELDDLKEVI